MITFYFILLGYYAYIESSSPRKRGDKARLMTGPLKGVYCLRFAYNMHGRTIGQLNIYHLLHGSELNIWWRKGQQTIARQWKTDNVTVYGNNYYVSSLKVKLVRQWEFTQIFDYYFFKEFLPLRCWLTFPQSLVQEILSNLKGYRQSSSF